MSPVGLKSKRWWDRFHQEPLQNLAPPLFQLLKASCIAWLQPFPHIAPPPPPVPVVISHSQSHSPTSLLQGPCDYTGPSWIIQDGLPSQDPSSDHICKSRQHIHKFHGLGQGRLGRAVIQPITNVIAGFFELWIRVVS